MMDPKLYPTGAGGSDTNFFTKLIKRTLSLNLASVAANLAAEQDVSVTGLEADEVVLAFYPLEATGVATLVGYARVKQAGTITVCVDNSTGGGLDAGAKSYLLITAKFGS